MLLRRYADTQLKTALASGKIVNYTQVPMPVKTTSTCECRLHAGSDRSYTSTSHTPPPFVVAEEDLFEDTPLLPKDDAPQSSKCGCCTIS